MNLLRALGWRGSGVAVPTLDGPLKPNQILENAEVVAELQDPSDLAADEGGLLVADGASVLRLVQGPRLDPIARADGPITALAAVAGGVAVAVGGTVVRVFGGRHDGRRWQPASTPFHAVNALTVDGDRALVATDGSQLRSVGEWKQDLLELGCSGRVFRLDLASGEVTTLASGLGHAFGAVQTSSGLWVSESWRHRLAPVGGSAGKAPAYPLQRLPAYPSRISRSATGGYWLTMFACRTQLVELVLRERDYCEAMMREVEPDFWVAPALSAGRSFLEPGQWAGIRQMGVIKPWAPPRAYGLVARLNEAGQPRYSLHSRVDGSNHGVVAAVEHGDHLYVLAKGPRRLLRVALADMPPEFGR